MFQDHQGVVFNLNKETLTANIGISKDIKGDIFIPFLIVMDSKEFIITEILKGSFKNSKIKSLKIAKNSAIQSIPKEAFANSTLESIIIPKNVLTIGEFAFYECEKLKSVEFERDSELYSIGKHAFESTAISSILIPNKIKIIECGAFGSCDYLKKVIFLENSELKIIENEAFAFSALESIIIPKKVLTIGKSAFYECTNLKSIEFELDSELYSIGESAFEWTAISSISIPNKVKIIKKETFYRCRNLKKVLISEESELMEIKTDAFSLSNIEELFLPRNFNQFEDVWCAYAPELKSIKISPMNTNFVSIGDKILFGKSNSFIENYDTIYFASRNIETVFIPPNIKYIAPFSLSNYTEAKIIETEVDFTKYKIESFWSDIPPNYKSMIKNINNEIMQRIYSKFTFKYFKFHDQNEYNIIFNLYFFLINFKFITFYFTFPPKTMKNSQSKINCIFCIENECLIIEQANLSIIQNLIKHLIKHVSLINLSNFSQFFVEPNYTAKDEIINFIEHYKNSIKNNFFAKYTIIPIMGFLIRRYFYPSSIFNDKSFFIFDNQNQTNEQNIKRRFKYYLFKENFDEYDDLDDIDTLTESIIENESLNNCKCVKESYLKFKEEDFIILRTMYIKNNSVYKLVIHIPTFFIFMIEKFSNSGFYQKEKKRKIDFCKYSHRCITPFYGFIMIGSDIIGLIYKFMSNGSLDNYIKKNQVGETFLLTTIGRIFEGIQYLHKNKLIHRDLKSSNILIDNDNLAYISDFDTIRLIDLSEGPFTFDFGTPLYSSPEQDNGGNISYPTDIYSFGLIIYFLYEKTDMWSKCVSKNEKIIPMSNGPENIKLLYEKCVKYQPNDRISNNDIHKILYKEFNSFLYFEEYLIPSYKKQFIGSELIDFIYEKIIISTNINLWSCKNQIKLLGNLLTLPITEAKFDFIDYNEQISKFDNPVAFNKLGNLYVIGDSIKQDYSQALKYYELSSKLNNSDAFFNLGYIYENGLGVKQDYSQALKYYELSSKLNNSTAFLNLGKLYEKGLGVKQDYSQALKYYELSSKLNNSHAFFNLGYIYENGLGVKQDYSQALKYYELSSKLNNSTAFNNLGNLYENGLGVKQDYSQALKYFELSSKLNNPTAFLNLGYIYENGLGVKQDYSQALKYYELSSKLNNSEAFLNLGNLYLNGLGVKQDYSQALKYYELSSKFNNSTAFNNLGKLYLNGLGVKQDYSRAIKYFELSSYLNNSISHYALGSLYSTDNFIELNIKKAIKYYMKSIKIQRGMITIEEKGFRYKCFEPNNFRYFSFNDLGLIYISIFNDIEKGEEYLKESAFAEFSFGQNNFGLINQFYLNNIEKAHHFYRRSSEHNFSLAEFNLGKIYEKQNKTKESVDYYKLALKHKNEPLIFRGIKYFDYRFEVSKLFIICLANMKLVKYYLSLDDYNESKKYFNRAHSEYNHFIRFKKTSESNLVLTIHNLFDKLVKINKNDDHNMNEFINNAYENKNSISKSNSNLIDNNKYENNKLKLKTIFKKYTQFIIDIMEKLLYTPPYLILFGRISLAKPKNKIEERNRENNRKDIDENFYEGFGI